MSKKNMKRKQVSQADIQRVDGKLQNQNAYSAEDSGVARICLALLTVGANKEKVKMLAAPLESKAKFEEYWRNLKQNHWFGTGYNYGKIVLDESPLDIVELSLMMLSAKGFLHRRLQ